MMVYDSYQNSNIHWYGDTPTHWKTAKGKFLFKSQKDLNGELQCKDRLSLTMSGVIEKDIENNSGLNPSDFITYQIFEQDNLVFKLIDLDNKKTSRVGYVHKKGIMSSAYIRLIKNNNSVNMRYFYYQYYDLYLKYVYNYLGSGVRSTLTSNDLLDIELIIPPLEEQNKIVAYIDKKSTQIENFIQKKTRFISLLKEEKEAVINEAITKGIDKTIEFKDSGIKWLGDIPKHWEVRKLKFVAKNKTDKKLESNFKIGLENIESKTSKFIESEEVVFAEAGIEFKRGDILFGKLRPYLAKIYLTEKDGICVSEFLVLRCFEITNQYLKYLMISSKFIDIVNGSTYGSKMPRANWEFIGNTKIPLPLYEEQKQIVEYIETKLNQIDKIIDKTTKQIDFIKEYKTSLINESVSGKIKVS